MVVTLFLYVCCLGYVSMREIDMQKHKQDGVALQSSDRCWRTGMCEPCCTSLLSNVTHHNVMFPRCFHRLEDSVVGVLID